MPPARGAPRHPLLRQKLIPEAATSWATDSKRSGCRGANTISVCGKCRRICLNVRSSISSSSSTVLPQTTAGVEIEIARRSSRIKLLSLGAAISNLRLPLNFTRSAGAPIAISRSQSVALCARKMSIELSTGCSRRLNRLYPGNERSEIRELTTAIEAPAW